MTPKSKIIRPEQPAQTILVQVVAQIEPPEIAPKYKQINVLTGKSEVLVYDKNHGSHWRALNATQSERLSLQLDWLIAKWNTMIPTHWKYELA